MKSRVQCTLCKSGKHKKVKVTCDCHSNTLTSSLEELILLHTNKKSADQTAHPRSLVSAFVIRYLKHLIVYFRILKYKHTS